MRRTAVTGAAVTLAAALAGCGLTDPYAHQPSRPTRAAPAPTVTNRDPAPERGGTIPTSAARAQLATSAGLPTPQAALERFARVYVTWTGHTVAAVQRRLAAISLGQARAQALQAAASYGRDTALQHSQVTNTGIVIAIASGQDAAAGQWVVVTREQIRGRGDYAGLPPTVHVTYAQLTRTRDGWVVSRWSPQS